MRKRALVARRERPVLIIGGIFFAIGVSLLGVDLYLGSARYNENRRFEQDGQAVTGKVLAEERLQPRSLEVSGPLRKRGTRSLGSLGTTVCPTRLRPDGDIAVARRSARGCGQGTTPAPAGRTGWRSLGAVCSFSLARRTLPRSTECAPCTKSATC
jgi:hypothetical protein